MTHGWIFMLKKKGCLEKVEENEIHLNGKIANKDELKTVSLNEQHDAFR